MRCSNIRLSDKRLKGPTSVWVTAMHMDNPTKVAVESGGVSYQYEVRVHDRERSPTRAVLARCDAVSVNRLPISIPADGCTVVIDGVTEVESVSARGQRDVRLRSSHVYTGDDPQISD